MYSTQLVKDSIPDRSPWTLSNSGQDGTLVCHPPSMLRTRVLIQAMANYYLINNIHSSFCIRSVWGVRVGNDCGKIERIDRHKSRTQVIRQSQKDKLIIAVTAQRKLDSLIKAIQDLTWGQKEPQEASWLKKKTITSIFILILPNSGQK